MLIKHGSWIAAEGVKAEAAYAKDKTLPDPTSTDNPEFQIVLTIIKEGLPKNPNRWTAMSKEMEGVSEETTTGVKRLYEMQVSVVLCLESVVICCRLFKTDSLCRRIVSLNHCMAAG